MKTRSVLQHFRLNQSGQAQLLMVMAFSTVLATIGSAVLTRTLRTRFQAIEFSRNISLRSALDATARVLGDIYRTQAQCDPFVFNQRINQMRPDGLIDPAAQKFPSSVDQPGTYLYLANYLRQLDVPVSPGVNVTVSIGRIQVPEYRDCVYDLPTGPTTGTVPLKGPIVDNLYPNGATGVCNPATPVDDTNRPDFESGYTMDVQLELWASIDRIRVSQNIVFMNTCKDSNFVFSNAWRDGVNDPYFSYHTLVPAMDPTRETTTTVTWPTVTATYTEANMNELRALPSIAVGAGCKIDFNDDGAFNNEDIGIMEKAMRGYLNFLNVLPEKADISSSGC